MPAKTANDYARKYTEKDAVNIFINGAEYAANDDDCLCIQDVIHHVNIPSRTFYDLVKQFEVLQSIKEDMKASIVRRVNKKALESDYAAAPAIWRLKQMGESDQQNINVTSNGKALPDWMQED